LKEEMVLLTSIALRSGPQIQKNSDISAMLNCLKYGFFKDYPKTHSLLITRLLDKFGKLLN